MKIYIPHLNYTIKVVKYRARKEIPNAAAWTERVDRNTCHVALGEKHTPPSVAHEVVHVLQHICNDRDIDFVQDQEHMGYLMQFIMGKLLGYEWKV